MLVIGLVVGGLFIWLTNRAKLKHEYARARAEADAERATLAERLAGKEEQIRELRDACARESTQSNGLRAENAQALAELSSLTTRLEEERKAGQEKIELLTNAEEKLADAFKALSADALRKNNQSFLDLAKESLQSYQEKAKGDLEHRQQAIDQIIKPLKESLEKVDGKIGELERTRASAYSELREQVKNLATSQSQLQSETGNLVKALRVPHVRGRWGEIQLRRVVELAGMLQYCDFIEQGTVATEDGRIRPDLIVRLPGNRTIVVDSKVPFDAFYESISTTDEDIRAARLNDHARLVRGHITALSRKSYWEAVNRLRSLCCCSYPARLFIAQLLKSIRS